MKNKRNKRRLQLKNQVSAEVFSPVILKEITKSFHETSVLSSLSLSLKPHGAYCLMGPSGVGKTTLLRILLGLEAPDSGTIEGLLGKRFSAVFQEDRLLEGYTALENIRLAIGNSREVNLTAVCTRLLPAEALTKPVREFSGGMKRRTAILRALLAPSDIVVMDEPFTGLDPQTKLSAIRMINEYTSKKLLLISTHSEEDAKLLHAEIIELGI